MLPGGTARGDPHARDPAQAKPLGKAAAKLAPEFARAAAGLDFVQLPDGDVYAPQAGFVDGFPAARSGADGEAWLAHCYGMVGAGRDNAADSGNGAELYAVIGHAPRHLDRNVTLVGRVLHGIERLSTLPRGSGPLGFYERASERVPVRAVRLATEIPESSRLPLEVLRTDRPAFAAYFRSRRYRQEEWFLDPVGRVELCNVGVPVRLAPGAAR